MDNELHTSPNNGAVPVLMYHSVGRVLRDWAWSNLTVPASAFEDHLRWLRRAGYHTVDLYALHRHTTGEQSLPPKSLVLTFDDGYVDNWTYVTPLLRRYGFTGTVLVTPEFVDPGKAPRPTLDEVSRGEITAESLEVRGFMSWPELRAAHKSGVLSVQSHALTHTWYPVSNRVVGFHHRGDHRYWMDWNANPDDKPFYMRDFGQTRVAAGTPVYEHAKSLEARRFSPDPGEVEHLARFAERSGGHEFVAAAEGQLAMHAELARYRADAPERGTVESDDERRSRIAFELVESKRQIEHHLDAPVNFLVWPGGGYDDLSMQVGRDLFRGVTVRAHDRRHHANRPGESPGEIVRRGIPALTRGGADVVMGGRYLVQFIEEFTGVPGARRRRQILKLWNSALALAGVRR